MSDLDDDGALSADEFCIATHLVYNRLSGRELPRRLPDELLLSLQPVRPALERRRAPLRDRRSKLTAARSPLTEHALPQDYVPPERPPPSYVSEQQRVLRAFAAGAAGAGEGAAPPVGDLFAEAPRPPQLHTLTRDRPSLRYASRYHEAGGAATALTR